MAAAKLVPAMDAVIAVLETIPGLRVNEALSDQMTSPLAIVGIPIITKYHGTFAHGSFEGVLPVSIVVGKAIDQVGLRRLAAFLDVAGSSSIHAAIEFDKSLGGKVDSCSVIDFRGLTAGDQLGGLGFVGAVINLMLIAKGA